jgi:hypothetical protein
MAEVPLAFHAPSNETVDVKGAKTIMIKASGNEKKRYTVVLACCADGTKFPPLLTLSLLMLHICGVSKTFGEWYQNTNQTEYTIN